MKAGKENTDTPKTPGLIRFITIAYYCIFTAAAGVALWASVTTTISFRQNAENDLFDYNPENIPVLLACLLIVMAFIFILLRSDHFRQMAGYEKTGILRTDKIILPLLICIALYGLTLIFTIRGKATNDALMLDGIVNAFVQGDYSALRDGYLAVYPFQIGYVAVGQLIYRIFGPSNYIVYQLLNLASILLTMYIIYLMTRELFHSAPVTELTAVLAFGALFFYAYTTFVYNDIWSVFLQTAAMYFQIRYLNTEKIRYEAAAGVFLAFGYLMKTNCLIALIAMGLTLVFSACRDLFSYRKADRKQYTFDETVAGNKEKTLNVSAVRTAVTKLLMVILMVVMTFGLSTAVRRYYQNAAGLEKMPDGVSVMAYLAMGMQEDEGKAGWYNGFNAWTLTSNDFDSEAATETAKQAIRDRWEEWMSSKSLMVRFYYEKYISQWADPTCVSLREQELTARHVENQPALADWLVFGGGYRIAGWIMNVYHAVIYLGVVLYSIFTFISRRFRKNEVSDAEAMIVMFIFGGMAFHMLWEASSRYVIRYYLIMLPLAAWGYYSLLKKREHA